VNGSQTIVARYLYNPFGQVEGKWGPLADANVMQFSSMPHHNLSGLSLYAYRAYDPTLQRWLNRDPIGERGGSNVYGFVGNNPIYFYDAYGLFLGQGGYAETNPGGVNGVPVVNFPSNGNASCPTYTPPQLSQADPNAQAYEPPQQTANDALILGSDMNPFSREANDMAKANSMLFAAADAAGSALAAADASATMKDAELARDALGRKLGQKHATYTAGSKDGKIAVAHSGKPYGCAENGVEQQLGDVDQFTKAFGWRDGEWAEIPICKKCQANYSRNQFPSDVKFLPNGAWSKK
jgi:RHS repeat-associated protein